MKKSQEKRHISNQQQQVKVLSQAFLIDYFPQKHFYQLTFLFTYFNSCCYMLNVHDIIDFD